VIILQIFFVSMSLLENISCCKFRYKLYTEQDPEPDPVTNCPDLNYWCSDTDLSRVACCNENVNPFYCMCGKLGLGLNGYLIWPMFILAAG
jgi:hypothetical protein